MKSERLEFFKEFAYRTLNHNRLTGTDGNVRVRRLIESFLDYTSSNYRKEIFHTKKLIPEEAWLSIGDRKIRGVAYIGSRSIDRESYAKREYIEGDIALIPDLTREKALQAQEKGAVAVITYRSEDKADAYTYGSYVGLDIPVVSIRREDVPEIEDSEVLLRVKSSERVVEGTNFLMEIGRGPIIYIISHMDTTVDIYGAVGNGVGFLLLLFLYEELKENYTVPYRLRFLITDARELGMEGAKFHLRGGLKHVFYCINLEGVGWHNPCVLYRDWGGYNGEKINHMFYKHLQDMRVSIDFCEAKDRDGDHIPFKELGIQTLYLSSYPFTIRHTHYDVYDAISWDHVIMWYEVILSFLRRFHKL
ncbi:MAG: M28 family peptidase [Aquificaceae bacterium]|jgi:hypothetical protein|uniref:M28 family peptidase n=1 Tax=Hydrogenobacter sp. Uz 6-8 TaxID=3384828 RepID=UPI000F1C4794|nr:MAG: M28 family peptidase [Aquificota bacterium]